MSTSAKLPHEPVWMFRTAPEQSVRHLARATQLPLPLARILYQRGYTTPEAARQFLNPTTYAPPDPMLMRDMSVAVDRILKALGKGERIVIYGDYDVDGQASTALLVSALSSMGARVTHYIPSRLEEGYGLSCDAIRSLAPSTDLLISVDCGITSANEVALATRLGVDCVITDHHEPGDQLPAAVAVVNPKRPDCGYPDKLLAGCGVAYKLVCALYQAVGRDPSEAAVWLDLVALATIADVVPLVGENRSMVVQGLARFGERIGLRALCEVAGVDPKAPRAGQVAFSVAPRLNAAGRLDDASVGVRLLLSDDPDEATQLATALDQQNTERRQVEARIVEEAEAALSLDAELAAGRALVVAGSNWHPGVIGIVASRLVETYGRPTLVLSVDGDEAVGSARSVGPFNLHAALSRFKHYFTRFGGHSMAAGLSMPTSQIDDFRREFVDFANESLTDADLAPLVRIESVVEPGEVTLELAESLSALAPFGVGNPEPLVVVREGLVCESRRIGRDQSHWRLALRVPGAQSGTVSGIGFGLADRFADSVTLGDRLDIACSLGVNEWNGHREPQLVVRDVRAASAESQVWLEDVRDDGPSVDLHRQPAFTAVHDPAQSPEVHLCDWRQHGGDVRSYALHQAATTCETVLVWVHHPLRRGLHSRMLLEGPGDRKAEAYIYSNHLPPPVRKTERAALIFWSVPLSLKALTEAFDEARAWAERLEVHLTFTPELLRGAEARIARDIPDLEALRNLYRVVRGRAGRSTVTLRLSDLIRAVEEKGVDMSERGVQFGLEVFSEAGLVRFEGGEGRPITVSLVPTNGRKVDLTQGVRYNEGISQRESYYGYLTQIASLPGADLLGLVYRQVAGA